MTGRQRSTSRNLSQSRGVSYQQLDDQLEFDEIEYERTRLNQLLDFSLRNFHRIETEITLNILLQNILAKFSKAKEIIRNRKLVNLIRRACSCISIPIRRTTLATLRPFWVQVFLNKPQMAATVEPLFEVLLRKMGPIEFFDFFIDLLFSSDFFQKALLESLFGCFKRVSPVLLTHKQIVVVLRWVAE